MEITVRYVAFIHKDEDTGFGISFPDFPGCISVGDTRAEAVCQGAEALALHVEGMIEDGEPIPSPRSLRDIQADPDLAEWRHNADIAQVPDVASFIARLADTPGDRLFNPWFEWDECHDASEHSADVRRRHLEHYLTSRVGHAKYLLIAEAAGYQGAHFSGIAMTSERILLGHQQKCGILPCHVLPGLEPARTSSDGISGKQSVRKWGFTEPTATTVWCRLRRLHVNPLEVVLWNAVPWHPYDDAKGLLSNRTPTPCEKDSSTAHLEAFLDLYPDARRIAIGEVSKELLSDYDDVLHVRHPANGGADEFETGLRRVVEP